MVSVPLWQLSPLPQEVDDEHIYPVDHERDHERFTELSELVDPTLLALRRKEGVDGKNQKQDGDERAGTKHYGVIAEAWEALEFSKSIEARRVAAERTR